MTVARVSALTPYIAVTDARAALDWSVAHLGARVTVAPVVMPDGRVGHCELEVAGAPLDDVRRASRDPRRGAGPRPRAAVTLHLDRRRRRRPWPTGWSPASSTLDRGPEDSGVGRVAVFRDPFGHRWFLHR